MKIFCIGRNYAEHARELNNEVPSAPVIFMKPPTAVFRGDGAYYLPYFTENLQYEVELLVRISKNGKAIEEGFAAKYYDEIGLGIDFTARDLQNDLKEKKLPWEIAKGFDNSAVVGEFLQKKDLHLENLNFSLKKNDQVVQIGNTMDMIFTIDQIICHVSKYFTLQKGDIIFTGTPSGVGKVEAGDKLEGFIEQRSLFSINAK